MDETLGLLNIKSLSLARSISPKKIENKLDSKNEFNQLSTTESFIRPNSSKLNKSNKSKENVKRSSSEGKITKKTKNDNKINNSLKKHKEPLDHQKSSNIEKETLIDNNIDKINDYMNNKSDKIEDNKLKQVDETDTSQIINQLLDASNSIENSNTKEKNIKKKLKKKKSMNKKFHLDEQILQESVSFREFSKGNTTPIQINIKELSIEDLEINNISPNNKNRNQTSGRYLSKRNKNKRMFKSSFDLNDTFLSSFQPDLNLDNNLESSLLIKSMSKNKIEVRPHSQLNFRIVTPITELSTNLEDSLSITSFSSSRFSKSESSRSKYTDLKSDRNISSRNELSSRAEKSSRSESSFRYSLDSSSYGFGGIVREYLDKDLNEKSYSRPSSAIGRNIESALSKSSEFQRPSSALSRNKFTPNKFEENITREQFISNENDINKKLRCDSTLQNYKNFINKRKQLTEDDLLSESLRKKRMKQKLKETYRRGSDSPSKRQKQEEKMYLQMQNLKMNLNYAEKSQRNVNRSNSAPIILDRNDSYQSLSPSTKSMKNHFSEATTSPTKINSSFKNEVFNRSTSPIKAHSPNSSLANKSHFGYSLELVSRDILDRMSNPTEEDSSFLYSIKSIEPESKNSPNSRTSTPIKRSLSKKSLFSVSINKLNSDEEAIENSVEISEKSNFSKNFEEFEDISNYILELKESSNFSVTANKILELITFEKLQAFQANVEFIDYLTMKLDDIIDMHDNYSEDLIVLIRILTLLFKDSVKVRSIFKNNNGIEKIVLLLNKIAIATANKDYFINFMKNTIESDNDLQLQFRLSGGIDKSLSLIKEYTSKSSSETIVGILIHTVCASINNNSDNLNHFIKHNGIEIFLLFFESGNSIIHEYSGICLGSLSKDLQLKQELGERNALAFFFRKLEKQPTKNILICISDICIGSKNNQLQCLQLNGIQTIFKLITKGLQDSIRNDFTCKAILALSTISKSNKKIQLNMNREGLCKQLADLILNCTIYRSELANLVNVLVENYTKNQASFSKLIIPMINFINSLDLKDQLCKKIAISYLICLKGLCLGNDKNKKILKQHIQLALLVNYMKELDTKSDLYIHLDLMTRFISNTV